MRLEIHHLPREDVYKDTARVPEKYRTDKKGAVVREGRICKVVVSGKKKLLALRGKEDCEAPAIFVDEKTRVALNLKLGSKQEFRFRPVRLFGQFLWAWRAADPVYRIAARLGLLSVVLGLLGLLLGLWSLTLTLLR